MPHLQNRLQNLQLAGPVIEVVIVPPQPVIEALKAKGETLNVSKPPVAKICSVYMMPV